MLFFNSECERRALDYDRRPTMLITADNAPAHPDNLDIDYAPTPPMTTTITTTTSKPISNKSKKRLVREVA
jgi:hypothetical protein